MIALRKYKERTISTCHAQENVMRQVHPIATSVQCHTGTPIEAIKLRNLMPSQLIWLRDDPIASRLINLNPLDDQFGIKTHEPRHKVAPTSLSRLAMTYRININHYVHILWAFITKVPNTTQTIMHRFQ